MMYPIETQDFKNITLGYFDWVVKNKIVRVIRVVGRRKDDKIIDYVFKLDLRIKEVIDLLLKSP